MNDLPSCVLGHWLHSHEEDEPNITVYRPTSYNFPPSRGRMGFELQAGGKLIYNGIARTDGPEQSLGTWIIASSNLIKMSVGKENTQEILLEVVSCDGKVLKVKK